MHVFQAICYVASGLCFLVAIFRHKFAPITLDFIAIGLFLWVLPSVVTVVFLK